MSKNSLEKIKEKVFINSLQTCKYVGGYVDANSIIQVKCIKHNYLFETKWQNVKRDNRAHHICPYCQQEDKNERLKDSRIELECAYCHRKMIRPKSDLKLSKSGLFFCCRQHKDLAQRIESGKQFDIMRPDHYNNGDSQDYRKKALREYQHKCSICGYNEEPNILQVHHIDENRQNNQLNNLIVLCPNCHAKITYGKYKLIDRKTLVKYKGP